MSKTTNQLEAATLPTHYSDAEELFCACCLGLTSGRQWFNRDNGYGVCVTCADRIEKAEGTKQLQKAYGFRGVHFDLDSRFGNPPRDLGAKHGNLIGQFAKSVETGWKGKIIGFDYDGSTMLRMKGVNFLTQAIVGGSNDANLDDDDTQWFTPEDVSIFWKVLVVVDTTTDEREEIPLTNGNALASVERAAEVLGVDVDEACKRLYLGGNLKQGQFVRFLA